MLEKKIFKKELQVKYFGFVGASPNQFHKLQVMWIGVHKLKTVFVSHGISAITVIVQKINF